MMCINLDICFLESIEANHEKLINHQENLTNQVATPLNFAQFSYPNLDGFNNKPFLSTLQPISSFNRNQGFFQGIKCWFLFLKRPINYSLALLGMGSRPNDEIELIQRKPNPNPSPFLNLKNEEPIEVRKKKINFKISNKG